MAAKTGFTAGSGGRGGSNLGNPRGRSTPIVRAKPNTVKQNTAINSPRAGKKARAGGRVY